jgi:hypothetical protein
MLVSYAVAFAHRERVRVGKHYGRGIYIEWPERELNPDTRIFRASAAYPLRAGESG